MPSFYRLANGTVEIDGVRMHQTGLKSPLSDAKDKIRLLMIRKGDRVLDVCTGLGYSALAAANAGAKVVTVEIDEEVLALAVGNKDSKGLFGNQNIELVVDDAFSYLDDLPDASFGKIMHDPPRLSMAGELYSLEFYKKLFRVLRFGGLLFHYTGNPGKKSGKNIPKGVKNRLLEAGFSKVDWNESLQGFVCRK